MQPSSDKNIIDRKFREALLGYGARPSGRVWWRVSSSLNNDKKKYRSAWLIVLIGLLIMMGSSIALFESFNHSHKVAYLNGIDISETAAMAAEKSVTASMNAENKDQNEGKVSGAEITNNVLSDFIREENKSAEKSLLKLNDLSVKGEKSSIRKLELFPTLIEYSLSPVLLKEKKCASNCIKHARVRGYIGVATMFNTTWLIDEQAMSSANLKYQFTYGSEFGMQGGYLINNHWALAGAWFLNSKQGQRYKYIDPYERTTAPEYREKNISLTYMNLPLTVSYRISKFSGLLNSPVNLNFLLGGQYGKLISYKIDDVKGELKTNDLFYKNDLSAVAGIDYDFFTNKPIFYTVGLRASYGTNAFNGEVPNDYEFDQPHNLLIGIHCAMNFSLDKNGFIR